MASQLQRHLAAALWHLENDPAGNHPRRDDDTAAVAAPSPLSSPAAAAVPAPLLHYLTAGPSTAESLPARTLLLLTSRIYGEDARAVRRKIERLNALCAHFVDLYGDGPVSILRAPARINILGEHIDYVSYLPTASLPFGSREHDMIMLYRAVETEQVRGASTLGDYPPFDYDLREDSPVSASGDNEIDWLSYLYGGHRPPLPHWGNYVRGAGYYARLRYGARVARGYDFIIDSDIPANGGASSSSALVVLAGAAIRSANRIAFDRDELARDSARAEWYVGTRGGSMDHLAICLAQKGSAVHISFADHVTQLLSLPGDELRWVTFFSHPADKGRGTMLAYNERAAVARVLIPAIIEGWRHTRPHLSAQFEEAAQGLRAGRAGAADQIETLLAELPEHLTLSFVAQHYPDAYRECELAFPVLVGERGEHSLPIRAYAQHHVGEVRRVALAKALLDADRPHADGETQLIRTGEEAIRRRLGELLTASHQSLRDLYCVSTPEVESLVSIIRSDSRVDGARLMGGGFGGNVLALTTREHVAPLIARVQTEFYGPRRRNGEREGSIMVSTPGEGLSQFDPDAVWREAVEEFSAHGAAAAAAAAAPPDLRPIAALLDHIGAPARRGTAAADVHHNDEEAWPVIVAAGKGSRARATGLIVPKPLAQVAGESAVLRVLRCVRAAPGVTSRPPIVIVSPETESPLREALAGEEVVFVRQPEPRGTGDAVLRAVEQMKDFRGRAVVIWGTQPVIRSRTISRAIKLASLFDEYKMVVPTTLRPNPYAPLQRDARGRIEAARETHLEKADLLPFGETNIGLFVLKSPAMFAALAELRRQLWRPALQSYDRPGGELGFPNEMINYFAGREAGVIACPFVDAREEQGIKTQADVARCEQFILELRAEEI